MYGDEEVEDGEEDPPHDQQLGHAVNQRDPHEEEVREDVHGRPYQPFEDHVPERQRRGDVDVRARQ